MRTLEQGKTIEELENAVNKLAKSKHKTSAELHDLRNELEMTETQAREKKAQSSQTMHQLKSELQTTKQALDESRVREKQVRRNLKVLACRRLQVHPWLASFQLTNFPSLGGGRVLFCARRWLHIFSRSKPRYMFSCMRSIKARMFTVKLVTISLFLFPWNSLPISLVRHCL